MLRASLQGRIHGVSWAHLSVFCTKLSQIALGERKLEQVLL